MGHYRIERISPIASVSRVERISPISSVDRMESVSPVKSAKTPEEIEQLCKDRITVHTMGKDVVGKTFEECLQFCFKNNIKTFFNR